MGKLKNLQRERGRISIEESDNALGENGLQRSVIQERGFEFGLGLSTLLKKLQELMMLRLGGSEARKQKLIFLMKLL